MADATALPPAAEHFLQQLELESAPLPAHDRQQLLFQIREHLSESLDEGAPLDEVLARLGTPRELVLEAGGDTASGETAPGDTAPSATAPWQPGALLWLALAAALAGLLLLLWGGAGFAVVGRGRMLLPALAGLILLAAAAVVLVRGLRTRDASEADARAKRRFLHGIAIGAVVLGALGMLLAAGMILVTGRGRSLLLAIPALVLVVGGLVLALRGRRASPQRTS